MTRDELENLIYERTRCFVDAPVADCIFDLIAAEREACARACEKMADNIYSNSHEDSQPMPHAVAKFCAAAIRARDKV